MSKNRTSQAWEEIGYSNHRDTESQRDETEHFITPNLEHRAGLDLKAMCEHGYYECRETGHLLPATELGYPGGCPEHRCKVLFHEPCFYREPKTTLAMLRAIL